MKYNKIVKSNDYNKNSFLITTISCIVLLLALCYFGINSGVKGTYSATTCPSSSPKEIDGVCCPSSSTRVFTANGNIKYCHSGRLTWLGTLKSSVTEKSWTFNKLVCYDEVPDCSATHTLVGYSCYTVGEGTTGISTYTGVNVAEDISLCSKKAVSPETIEIISYTISFDTHGGNTINSMTGKKDERIILPTPTKTSCDFAGWYSSSSGGSFAGMGGGYYRISGNATLHARWTNCEDNSVQTGQTCGSTNYGTWTESSCNATVVSGKCHLWDSGSSCCRITEGSCSGSITPDPTPPSGGDTGGSGGGGGSTPTPTPSEKKYTATFDENGGTLKGDKTASCSTTGSSCTISGLPTATRDKYTFKGWGTSKSCTSGNPSSVSLSSDKTYYACWVKVNNETKPGTDSDGNVTENSPTGETTLIAFIWFFGLMAIGYAFYYFKSVRQN